MCVCARKTYLIISLHQKDSWWIDWEGEGNCANRNKGEV